jgi:hypothetical protein
MALYIARFGGEQAVAVFFDEQAAHDFKRDVNDEYQADAIWIEWYPLFDDYGFPIRPRDLFFLDRTID